MGDTLLLAIVIYDGVAGRFAASAGGGGDGNELDACVLVLLVEIELVFRHLAVELDALGDIEGTASAYSKDGVALGNLEEVNALADILVEGIGGEVAENDMGHAHVLYVVLNAEEGEAAVADEQHLLGVFQRGF